MSLRVGFLYPNIRIHSNNVYEYSNSIFAIRSHPYYKDMEGYTFVNGVKSATFSVMQGVRQGCITSNWYFLLYIDGLLKKLEESGTGCTIGSLKSGNPTLADDLVLIAPNVKALEKALKIVHEYSKQWRIIFNMGKCHLVIFTPHRHPTNVSVKFGSGRLQEVQSATHVGIELHQSLKSSCAVNARDQKGRAFLFLHTEKRDSCTPDRNCHTFCLGDKIASHPGVLTQVPLSTVIPWVGNFHLEQNFFLHNNPQNLVYFKVLRVF